MKADKLILKIRKCRKKLMDSGLTNKYIAEKILGANERTLSGICTGSRIRATISTLKAYVIVLEAYLQQHKK
jgi:hypothetical protein